MTVNRKYVITLTKEQRLYLEKLVSSGVAPARTIARAHILLKSDCGPDGPSWTYEEIRDAFGVSDPTIAKTRKTMVVDGLEAAIRRRKPNREYVRKLDGELEAHLIALACSEAPEGRGRWTLRLLQDKFVELGFVDSLSHETVRTTLKKTNFSLG
jgi:hypothetical protein